MSLMPVFDRFPKEAEIIGRIAIGYGELEIDWTQCLGDVLGNFTIAASVMYRLRSEGNRFEVGDAILKPYYLGLKLDKEYDQAYSLLSRCKQIRNNHTHCQWDDSGGNLFFTSLEESAKSRGHTSLEFHNIDMKLLIQQLALFENCQLFLTYLHLEGRARRDQKKQTLLLKPKALQLPPVHNPKGTAPHYFQDKK